MPFSYLTVFSVRVSRHVTDCAGRFLQVAAGHVASAERLHAETARKRAAYTSGLVRMLANAAATNKALVTSQRHGFTRTLLRLLRETEAIVGRSEY